MLFRSIGVGGGLIRPMQERWERMLSAAERETNTQLAAYQQGRTDAMRAPQRSRQGPGQPQGPGQAQHPGRPEDPRRPEGQSNDPR